MLDGTYQATVNTPLGTKTATATVTTLGDAVDFLVEVPGLGKYRAKGAAIDDVFVVQGSVKLLLTKRIDFTAEGFVDGDTLTADFTVSGGAGGKKRVIAYRV